MKNIIRIKGAMFYAYHGVFKEEQNIGGKFEADIELHTDFLNASLKDDLKKTVDYEAVYKLLSDIAIAKKYYLLEALAMNIVNSLLIKFSNVHTVVVRVRKNNPPIGGVVDSVEVEIEKSRSELVL